MLNVGVIGCGQWGANYIRIFNQISTSSVSFVCDLDEKRLKYIKELYPEVNTTTDFLQILRNPKIEAVCIATSASTHYEIAKESLNYGKNVLVEKPMALSSSQCEELIKISTSRNLILMVGHVFEFNEGINKIKEYIKSGELGEIFYLHSTRTNLGPLRKDVNAMWDLAPHDVCIFLYLLDVLPESVSAVGKIYLQKNLEDVSFITLNFPKNILGNIRISWLDPRKIRELTVVGSKKMVVFDDLNPIEPIRLYDKGIDTEKFYDTFGEFQLILRDGDIIIPKIKATEPLRNLAEYFIECIHQKNISKSSGEDGINVVKVLEAIEKSIKKNGAPCEVK